MNIYVLIHLPTLISAQKIRSKNYINLFETARTVRYARKFQHDPDAIGLYTRTCR